MRRHEASKRWRRVITPRQQYDGGPERERLLSTEGGWGFLVARQRPPTLTKQAWIINRHRRRTRICFARLPTLTADRLSLPHHPSQAKNASTMSGYEKQAPSRPPPPFSAGVPPPAYVVRAHLFPAGMASRLRRAENETLTLLSPALTLPAHHARSRNRAVLLRPPGRL